MLDGMTNIKAREVLKELKDYTEDLPHYSPDEVAEAIEMAIKALEQQRNLTNEELYQSFINLEAENERLHDALEAQPKDEDCISREAVRELICQNNDYYGYSDRFHEFTEKCLQLPPVTPRTNLAETSQDCISREAMLSLHTEYAEKIGATTFWKLRDDIRALPPVTPERPKGKWIRCKSRFGKYFKCSECGRKLNWIDRDDNYCNNCGSDNSESTKEFFKEWDARYAEMSGGEEDGDSN